MRGDHVTGQESPKTLQSPRGVQRQNKVRT